MRKDVVNGMVIKDAVLKTDNGGRQYAVLTVEENRMKLLGNGVMKRTGRIFHCVTAYNGIKDELLECRRGDILKLTGHHYFVRKCKNPCLAFNATTVRKYAAPQQMAA